MFQTVTDLLNLSECNLCHGLAPLSAVLFQTPEFDSGVGHQDSKYVTRPLSEIHDLHSAKTYSKM